MHADIFAEVLEQLGVVSPTPSNESFITAESPENEGHSPRTLSSSTLSDDDEKVVPSPLEPLDPGILRTGETSGESILNELATQALSHTEPDTLPSYSTTMERPHKFVHPRPYTPPPSSQGPQKVTFISTATGIIPTNTEASVTTSAQPPPLPRSIDHKASKESFTNLVRSRLPSPEPETFKLIGLSEPPHTLNRAPSAVPSETKSTRIVSVGALKHALSMRLAKQK